MGTNFSRPSLIRGALTFPLGVVDVARQWRTGDHDLSLVCSISFIYNPLHVARGRCPFVKRRAFLINHFLPQASSRHHSEVSPPAIIPQARKYKGKEAKGKKEKEENTIDSRVGQAHPPLHRCPRPPPPHPPVKALKLPSSLHHPGSHPPESSGMAFILPWRLLETPTGLASLVGL